MKVDQNLLSQIEANTNLISYKSGKIDSHDKNTDPYNQVSRNRPGQIKTRLKKVSNFTSEDVTAVPRHLQNKVIPQVVPSKEPFNATMHSFNGSQSSNSPAIL